MSTDPSIPEDFWKWLLMKYQLSKENFKAPPEQHVGSTRQYNNPGPCQGPACFTGRTSFAAPDASSADLQSFPEGLPCNNDGCSAELSNSGFIESHPCIAKDCETGMTNCKDSDCDMGSYDNSKTSVVKGEEFAPCVGINCGSRTRSSIPCSHGECDWGYPGNQKHVNPDVEYPYPKRYPYDKEENVKTKPTKTIKDIEPSTFIQHKIQRYIKRINKKYLNTKFVNMIRSFNFKYSVTTAGTVDFRKFRPIQQIYHTTARVPLDENTFIDKSSNDAPCTGDECLSPQAQRLRSADCPKGYTAILQNNFVLCAPPDDADEFQGLLPVCPWGQQLIFSSDGVICKDPTTQGEDRCPEGQTRVSTPEGMACQIHVTDSDHCPPGHVLTETPDDKYCKEITTENTIECNEDQKVVTTDAGTFCQDRARPCPAGLVALDTPIGIVCTYDTGAQKRNDRDIKETAEDITDATTLSGCPLDKLSPDGKTCKYDYIPDGCPSGQILHDTDLGLKCLPIRNEDLTKLTCLEGQSCFVEHPPVLLICHDNSRPIVSYAGKKICQDGSIPQNPSPEENVCPDGTRMVTLHGRNTCENDVAPTLDCISGGNCDGALNAHPCPLGLIPVIIRGQMECRYQDIENDGEDICPSGLKWVTIHEHGRCFDITTMDVNAICPNGETLLSVGNGYQCEPPEEKINCPYGMKIKITENGPRCKVDNGENNVASCSEGEILVNDYRGTRCFTMTGGKPLCEKGYLPQISGAGVTCIPDDENEIPACPEGFEVKGTETEPYCGPVVEPLCPEGYTVSASAGWPLCVQVEAETCPRGYVTNPSGDDSSCVPQNKPICGSSRILNVLLGQTVCGTSSGIQDNSQPCFAGSEDPNCSRQTSDCSKNVGKCQTKKCPSGQKLIHRNNEYFCEVVPVLEYDSCNPQCANGGRCANGSCVCTSGVYGETCQLGK